MQEQGIPHCAICPHKEKDFYRPISGCFSPPLPVWRSHQRDWNGTGSVHCLLRSDLESFSREGFIPSKGQQPAQSKQIGEDEAPSDLPSAPSMPSVEELVCKHASGRRAMESCADEWRGSNPNCSALCFATFTHIHFPPAGCRVLYLQLPNYRSATACVLPRMRKWGHMAFVIRDLCALSVQQRCNFLYKSIYKTKHV